MTRVEQLEIELEAAKKAERAAVVKDMKTLKAIAKAGFCVLDEMTGKPYGYTKGSINHVQSYSKGIFEVNGERYYGKMFLMRPHIFKVTW